MKSRKGFLPVLFSVAFVVALSACGGGGSGSGGGGETSFAGTYTGSANIVVTAPNGASVSNPAATTIVINPDGTVIVDPGTPGEFRGTITGNTLTASFDASSLNQPGLTCTGPITITGTADGNTISGPITGNTTCNGIPFTVSGSFTVTRSVAKAPLRGTALGDQLGAALRQLVP